MEVVVRVAAMFRVSTEAQANEGASLDAQERRFHELAKKHAWHIVATFRGCESATQAATERQVLQRLLACIRQETVDAIYVHEQSRLTRGDELEVAMLLRELRDSRLKIIVGGVIRDLSSIDERFMIGIQSLVDRAEAERIKERVMRGKNEKARKGLKNCGAAPYGYVNPPPGHHQRGRLEPVEHEAAVVRRIFRLASEGVGIRQICRLLNGEGTPSPRGATWGKTTIQRILSNPAYIGIHASNVWRAAPGSRTFRLDLASSDAILVEDAHPAIIPRDQWEAVHARPNPATARIPNMLTGLLWVNGSRYAGDTNHSRSVYRNRKRGRGDPWLDVGATDSAVWQAFASLARGPALVQALLEASDDAAHTEGLEEQTAQQEALVRKLRARLERLVDMRADGEIGKAVFADRSSRAQATLSKAEATLGELRSRKAVTSPEHAVHVVSAVRALIGDQRRLDRKQKRKILQSATRRVEVEVERSMSHQGRGRSGRFGSAREPKWKISGVTFEMGVGGSDRAGYLAPASSCWGPRGRARR